MKPHRAAFHGNLIPPSRSTATLTLHQGGLARRPTARQLLDRATRDIAASTKRVGVANSTAYPSRAVADMAIGARTPLRIIGRIIEDNLKGGGPIEFGERLGHAILLCNAQIAAELGRAVERSAAESLDKAA